MTKNITLAIDDDLLDKARVLAAMRRTSVNAMVRSFLEREVEKETAHARQAEEWTKLFRRADANADQRRPHRNQAEGEARFDRLAMYDEVIG